LREELRIAKGERYELCRSVHAETNAVIHAGRDRCIGGTIYVVGVEVLTNATLADIPCSMCFRVLRNAGISEIVTLEHQIEVEGYREKEVVQSK
jgi:dCMP deaminase